MRWLTTFFMLLTVPALRAQQRGAPGQFDFYLLNVVPAAEFCDIKDVGPGCVAPQKPWVLHGLWPQRIDGTYPAFCQPERPGPAHPERNEDLTPDLALLGHEWQKHGTCTTLSAKAFFAAERKAFRRFSVPLVYVQQRFEVRMKPAAILAEFARANPAAPAGSLILWCSEGRLTSVSECVGQDLKPVACQGLKSCADDVITLRPPRVN